jgi:hypothetical protein
MNQKKYVFKNQKVMLHVEFIKFAKFVEFVKSIKLVRSDKLDIMMRVKLKHQNVG